MLKHHVCLFGITVANGEEIEAQYLTTLATFANIDDALAYCDLKNDMRQHKEVEYRVVDR